MIPDRKEQIIDLLTKYDLEGTPFLKAKEELLAQGFTDAEIAIGLYAAPFDGKDNRTKAPNPLEKTFAEHPEEAEKVARGLLQAEAERDANRRIAEVAASRFAPGWHAQSSYEAQSAYRLGLPYFSVLFGAILLIIISIKFNIPNAIIDTVFSVVAWALAIATLYKLVRKWLLAHKLRGK